MSNELLTLAEYFKQWMETYKKPAISHVTYIKYQNTHKHIVNYFGDMKLKDISRTNYQVTINEFALSHAKRTTLGFHKHVRAAILDAVEDGILLSDFTRKAIITGRVKKINKSKFLSYSEWQTLIKHTSEQIPYNSHALIVYLSAITGMRFSEALGLTVADIDLNSKCISVNKTWDYKYHTGYKTTKNKSSVRTVDIDDITIELLQSVINTKQSQNSSTKLCGDNADRLPVSATINRYLESLCLIIDIPIISFHALRHTHASILLYKKVNILSVSKRLGHKDVSTTQNIYLHLIKEMEERETDLIIQIMNEAIKQ